MKTMNLFLCVMFLFVSLSCQQEELMYSCDKQVDSWVKSNLSYVKSMDRTEWESVDEGLKRGCYVAFSPQQRQHLWLGKFNEALSLDWSMEEKEHIKVMIDFVQTHLSYFDSTKEDTDDEVETIEVFAYKWIKKAVSELGWNRKLIGGLVASPNAIINKEGTLKFARLNSDNGVKTRTEVECHCNQDDNWCSIEMSIECLPSDDCEISDSGCGFLWLSPCNGRCNGI